MKQNNGKEKRVIILDKAYAAWVKELAGRYRGEQIKAACSVNSAMLHFYWSLGKDISSRRLENKYGSGFFERVSADLRKELGIQKGLSATTIKYSKYFFELYSTLETTVEANRQRVVDDFNNISNRQQVADDFKEIFTIPWTHHMEIINKVDRDTKKAMFYVHQIRENNWGRGVLMHFLSTNLYENQGKAQTNFKKTLPGPQGDLAQQMIKNSYNFEFLQMGEQYSEKQMKDELVGRIIQFLLELGRGFSFVGKEYHLKAGDKDKYIDLLFYVIPLHSYCVVEVKTTEFDFPDIGQLAGYVAMVDDLLNTSQENPSIGLLICKEKDTILSKYALANISAPIGISEYEVARKSLPKNLQNTLPTPEEIAEGLKKI